MEAQHWAFCLGVSRAWGLAVFYTSYALSLNEIIAVLDVRSC